MKGNSIVKYVSEDYISKPTVQGDGELTQSSLKIRRDFLKLTKNFTLRENRVGSCSLKNQNLFLHWMGKYLNAIANTNIKALARLQEKARLCVGAKKNFQPFRLKQFLWSRLILQITHSREKGIVLSWLSYNKISIKSYNPIRSFLLLFCSYSFGYDCVLRNNLHVLDSKTLLFVTGNLIHFLDVESGYVKFRQSALGLGISCVAVRLSNL